MRNRSPASSVVRLAAVVIVFLLYAPARAETPPDHVETCTLEKRQQPGEECIMCGAWDGDAAKCQKRLGPRGYERRCRGDGASVWSEVWCHRSKPAQSE
jgi:hypothetical protein